MPVVDSHYGSPDTSSRLAIPASVFAVVTPMTVLLRLVVSKGQKSFGLDDWTILAAMVVSEAMCVMLILVGNDLLGSGPREILKENSLVLLFCVRILYQVAIGVTKISVCLFFRKAFGAVQWCRNYCWGLMVFIAAFTVASIVATVLGCQPIRHSWSGDVNAGSQCIDLSALSTAIAVFDASAWIIIMVLGTLIVWRLEWGTLKKSAVGVVFPLGGCLIAASILRAISYRPFLATYSARSVVNENLCVVLEVCLGIIFACLPTFYRALRKVSAAFLGEPPDADEMSLGACAGEYEPAAQGVFHTP